MTGTRQRRRPLALLLAVAALVAACGGDDDQGSSDLPTALSSAVSDPATPPATAGSTTGDSSAADTSTAPDTTDSPGGPGGPDSPDTTGAAATTIAAPSGGVYPGAEWSTAELPADVDREALDAAVDAAFGAADATSRVQSIVIVQGGEITYERYHPLDGPDDVMNSYSVSKSFASTVIGLLVGDGLLDVSERAPVEAWADPADPRHAITLEHLLHMASGLEWTEEYGPSSQALAMLQADNAAAYAASFPLEAEPGVFFDYSTGTTAILAGIAIQALGGPEEFEVYLQERLLDPLDITSTQLLRDRGGWWYGGLGANHTTRDFARFGLLFLNDGVWEGERILPEGWVEYSRTPSPSNADYGAQWWITDSGAMQARGLFGQLVHVDAAHDVVIAINATQGGDSGTLITASLEALGVGTSSE